MLEERRARPGWGDDLSPLFLAAWRDGELLPVGELNNGFVRPNSPEQIGLSYYQASLVVELIERDWGKRDDPRHAARLPRQPLDRGDPASGQLKIELAEFDQRFDAFLEESFGGAKRALGPAEATPEEGGGEGSIELPDAADLEAAAQKQPDNFPAQLSWGIHLVQEERAEEAEPFLVRARDLYPQYVGPDSPYLMLAKIYRDRGDDEKAAGAAARLPRRQRDRLRGAASSSPPSSRSWATARRRCAPLEEAIYVYPLDPELHRRMAELYQGDRRRRRSGSRSRRSGSFAADGHGAGAIRLGGGPARRPANRRRRGGRCCARSRWRRRFRRRSSSCCACTRAAATDGPDSRTERP